MDILMIRLTVLLGLLLATTSYLVNAIPVQPNNALLTQLNKAQFVAKTVDLTTVVEDFEGFSPGFKSSPFTFSNGRYTSTVFDDGGNLPSIAGSSTFCGLDTPVDQCLLSGFPEYNRTLDVLPAETTYWSVDMFYIQPSNIIDVTVYGGSGKLNFKTEGLNFYGFNDPLGIKSIVFNNIGTGYPDSFSYGNYSFDNITTAFSVPEPMTLSLLVYGLLLMLGVSIGKAHN
jgi:hypothetical protein